MCAGCIATRRGGWVLWYSLNHSITQKARVDSSHCGFECAQAIRSKMGDTRFTLQQIKGRLHGCRQMDLQVSRDATFVALGGYAGDLIVS